MKSNQWIVYYVAHIYRFPSAQYFRMFTFHKPTDMSEKKTTMWIVRIGVSFAESMMHSMVANPLVYCILNANQTRIIILFSRSRIVHEFDFS